MIDLMGTPCETYLSGRIDDPDFCKTHPGALYWAYYDEGTVGNYLRIPINVEWAKENIEDFDAYGEFAENRYGFPRAELEWLLALMQACEEQEITELFVIDRS